jgi:hypothetical protein
MIRHCWAIQLGSMSVGQSTLRLACPASIRMEFLLPINLPILEVLSLRMGGSHLEEASQTRISVALPLSLVRWCILCLVALHFSNSPLFE